MIFSKEETVKRIKNNYAIFGSEDSVKALVVNNIFDNERRSIIEYTITRNGSVNFDDIDLNFISVSDSSFKINTNWLYNELSDNVKKRSILSIFKLTKDTKKIVPIPYINKFGITASNTIKESENSSTDIYTDINIEEASKEVEDINKVSLVYIFTKTKGLDNFSIYEEEITREDIEKDPLLEAGSFKAVFNSIDAKINVNRQRIETLYQKDDLNQMTYNEQYKNYIKMILDESIETDDNGEVTRYINNDFKLESISEDKENGSTHYISVNGSPIYGEDKTVKDGKIVFKNTLYGAFSKIDGDETRVSYYLNDDCDELEAFPEEINEPINHLLAYLDGDITLSDPEDETTIDDKIEMYKDKSENIYTMVLQTEAIEENLYTSRSILRIIDNNIAYAYVSKGTKYKIVVINLENDTIVIDSETDISCGYINDEQTYTFSTKFDNGKLKFNRLTTMSESGIKSLFYSGLDITVDVDYFNKKYNQFDSVIYNKSDKNIYIRDEYGALVKLANF